MKKYLFFLLLIITFIIPSFGQDTVKIYAGSVGAGFVSTKNTEEITKFVNLRIGANFEKNLSKQTTAKTWFTFDPGSNLVIFQAVLKTKISKNFFVQYGYGPTPATLIRPFPLSVDGQFQFTAESMPPNGALGGFIAYENTKLGVYTRNKYAEYHFGQKLGVMEFGFWLTEKNNSGATIQLISDNVYLMTTITNENKQALATAIKPFRKSSWKIVHDFGISKGKVTNNLLGLLYPMKIKKFTDTRFGIAYDFQNNLVGAFWLIGIDR